MSLAKQLRARNKKPAKKIDVKAWADEDGIPFSFYTYNVTCNDLKFLESRHPKFLENTTISSMVDLILLKAVDESGEKIFGTAEDRIELMGEEITVISDIAEKMFSTIDSVDTAKKKLRNAQEL